MITGGPQCCRRRRRCDCLGRGAFGCASAEPGAGRLPGSRRLYGAWGGACTGGPSRRAARSSVHGGASGWSKEPAGAHAAATQARGGEPVRCDGGVAGSYQWSDQGLTKRLPMVVAPQRDSSLQRLASGRSSGAAAGNGSHARGVSGAGGVCAAAAERAAGQGRGAGAPVSGAAVVRPRPRRKRGAHNSKERERDCESEQERNKSKRERLREEKQSLAGL